MKAPAFETERTIARDWRPDEAGRFFDIYRRWEVARWLGAEPAPMADPTLADERIERWARLNADQQGQGRWAVERKDDGVVVGTVILLPLPDGDGEIEVGWHLHPDSWGAGFATEAGRGAVDLAFSGGVDEVFAVVRPDNTASVKVCRRVGMEHLGRTSKYYSSELELFRIRLPDQERVSG